MLGPRRRIVLSLVVGVLLLANGAWLYPENVSHETRYTYEAETENYPPTKTYQGVSMTRCTDGTPRSPDCAVAHYLADGNVIATDGGPAAGNVTAVPEEFYEPERTYYDMDTGYYRLNATVADGELLLRFEELSLTAFNRAMAENYSEVPDVAQRAIDDGSATSRYDLDTHWVERNGTFYEVRMVGWEHVPTGWGWKEPPLRVVETLRWLGYLGGLLSVWYAGVLFGWVRWYD